MKVRAEFTFELDKDDFEILGRQFLIDSKKKREIANAARQIVIDNGLQSLTDLLGN